MDIRPTMNPIADYLDEMDASENDSWLSQKTSQLLTFFHILIPDITNEEEQLVDEAIIKTYNLYKITHDNDSIYVPEREEAAQKCLSSVTCTTFSLRTSTPAA